jgi:hypothetical protein
MLVVRASGRRENSPALQRWEARFATVLVRERTAEDSAEQ